MESGALDFHHVATVSKAIRQIKKTRKVTAKEKCELIEKLQSKNESTTKQMVAEFFDLEVIQETKKSVQTDSSVRIEITISSELAQKLEQAQGLMSHAVPAKNLPLFLEYLCDKIIKQKTAKPRESKKSTSMMEARDVAPSKPIPQRAHRIVRNQQIACNNRGSMWFPQTDHKKSRWAGGTNNIENLQTLCGPCNRAKYRREWDEVAAIKV